MTIPEIAAALEGRKSGACWKCRCPAHDDTHASLSLSAAEDGKPLVHCHAGCTQDRVISVLRERGLWSDSARESHAADGSTKPNGMRRATTPKRVYTTLGAAVAANCPTGKTKSSEWT